MTSGNYSPSLGRGIGLGYVTTTQDDAVDLEVEIRDRWLETTEVEPPFLSR